jgi:phenylpropionate dioxygenase-like ring-hydroxylating dioxygenase large terminal subunit
MTVTAILEPLVQDIRRGMIPATIYSDEELFALEREQIFAKAWLYLGHESEIAQPGDYVLRRIVDDSFIVIRDENGTVRVHYNMCLHRGMQLCRAEIGNTSHFRCPYHAWTYRNTGELNGVPFHKDAYGGEDVLPIKGRFLLSPPRVEIRNGMIFASLSAEAPDLDDYLGGFGFFLDLYTRQSEAGPEVRGPQRWVVEANWKIAAENFAGDTYHTPVTHSSIVEIGLFREPKARKRKEGALYWSDIGGGTTYKLPAGSFEQNMAHVGYPEEVVASAKRVWTPQQRAMVSDAGFMISAATIFPNLSFVHNWPVVDEDGLVAPFISIRLWQPISATRTEIFSWFAVDRGAPEWFKEASYKAYLMCFGSSGMFEQDDVENWNSITQMAKGHMARDLRLNSRMGLDTEDRPLQPRVEGWPGPGEAYTGFGEQNQRSLLRLWGDYMLGNGATATTGNGKPRRASAAARA